MPALPAVPGTIRTACSGTFNGGGVWLTRFFTHYTGTAPTNAQLRTFDTAISTAWGTDLKSLHGAGTSLTQVASEDLTSVTSAVDTFPTTVVGTRTGGGMPGSACVVASYVIARRYRGGHPRGYYPFGTDTDVSTQQDWTAALVTASNTGLTAFFAAIAAAGWTGAGTLTQVNVGFYTGFTVVINPTTGRARNVPTLRVAPNVDTVTAIACKNSIGTQRRRLDFID